MTPETGALSGETGRYEKRLRDLAGLFDDGAAYGALVAEDPDRLVYEVHEHRSGEESGDLIFGTSVLQPGRVGTEFHMTRGHLHALADRSEIYHCVAGRGLLLMETLAGAVHVAELEPGKIAYVPPHWIHRSVNVGSEPFVTVFCYPADAGQDYEVIAAAGGMRRLVVTDGDGGWTTVDNDAWRRDA